MSDRPTRRTALLVGAGLLVLLVAAQMVPYYLTYPHGVPEGAVPEQFLPAFNQAAQLARASEWSGLAKRFSRITLTWLLFAGGVAGWVDRRYGNTALRWGARLLFFAALAFLVAVCGLPRDVHAFAARRAAGLTTMGNLEWFRIAGLRLLMPTVTFALGNLLVYCIMGLARRAWWIASVIAAVLIFQLLPEWVSLRQPIDPVRKLTPMPESPFRSALETVASTAGYHLDYYLVDHSTRGRQVNMYVTGRLGREYVVVTDTMLDAVSEQQGATILAHELSHQENRGYRVAVVKAQDILITLLCFYFAFLVRGRRAIPPADRMQVVVLVYLISQVMALATLPLTAATQRYEERQADRYALQLTGDPEGFSSALLRVCQINLTPYHLPTWVYWLGATHPTPAQRLAFAASWPASPR